MPELMKELEDRIDALRQEVRRAATAGDRARMQELRAELRRALRAWDEALIELAEPAAKPELAERRPAAGPLLPVREHVHQALTLLSVPAAPKLITAVHDALFAGGLDGRQLTSVRRDEERSFRAAPHARPYYLCAALTADRLSPARGLLAVSTWPMPDRIVGPLSPRADFLTCAIQLAGQIVRVGQPALPAMRLLWRFAANIPGAATSFEAMDPAEVERAARVELDIHHDADRAHREQAAARARNQLDEAQQLFGVSLRLAPHANTQN